MSTDKGLLITAAVRDVSDRQQIKDLERANQNLKMFSYSVSRDPRTPPRALSGFSEALLEEHGDALGEEGRGYAEEIVEGSVQMATLIDERLNISRISRAEVHLRAVDLGAEAARIAGELQRRESGRHVSFAIQRPVPARADPALIRTVPAEPDGEGLEVLAQARRRLDRVRRDDGPDGGLRCRVRDNGAGFDPAFAGRLFEPFQRLHSMLEFPGTGVGPASVRQIVEHHGGQVAAEGADGNGATFYFTLPAEEPT